MSWGAESKTLEAFLTAWPPERVRDMTLEEYTNPDRDGAFIYWLEKRLEKHGSIWGGSAFKFGVYHRDDTEAKEASRGRVWGDTYAWLSKYGTSAQEAFGVIRAHLAEVIEAAQSGNFERIDEIDLAPTIKWKVAFLYQDSEHPGVFPIFKRDALFHHYQAIDPTAKRRSTAQSVMYATLLGRHQELGDPTTIAYSLWSQWEADKQRVPKAWALPVGWLDSETVDLLCSHDTVEPEDIDGYLENLLAGAELSAGDHLVVLVDGDVRAVGELLSTDPGEFSWRQTPVDFPSGLLVNPTSEVKKLSAAEWQDIKSQMPSPEGANETTGPHYWKISPGSNGVAWPEWQDRGIVAIGWPELGDLKGLTRKGFDKRAAECAQKHGYKKGMSQAWHFSRIQAGDRVVANQGTHTVLGIGTVVQGYAFTPGEHAVGSEDFPHQLRVEWNETSPRKVHQSGWRRTLLELTEASFDGIISGQSEASTELEAKKEPSAPPRKPKNIILFGPPGTGKTYSTVRRALELILGAEKLAGLDERALTALFREHQSRGQIEFVTFHQAYGYEEFVEGLRPVLDDADGKDVRYELHDGVFKRIALRAAAEGLRLPSAAPEFDELWSRLVDEIKDEDERLVQSQSGKSYLLRISSRGNINTYPCQIDDEGHVDSVAEKVQTASTRNSKVLWEQRHTFGVQPDNLTYQKAVEIFDAGNHYTALWMVYKELLQLSRGPTAHTEGLINPRARVQQALDKSTAGGASFGFSSSDRQYVLIIDEINRGNVSKILGELITLLEPDKRLGTRNELKLPLSYSPEHRFAVPPNLHILGTMNTADRSIALMDVALRRRFTFEELMPSTEVIRNVLRESVADKELIDLTVDLFETLNARIRFLYDRDHQLGHSYFLGVRSLDDLRMLFVDRVIPLLQEYFYGAWDKICMVLGCPYDEAGVPRRGGHLVSSTAQQRAYVAPIVSATAFREVATLGFDHDEYEDRVDFSVRRRFQDGTLTDTELVQTLLGVLQLDQAEFDARLAVLNPSENAEETP